MTIDTSTKHVKAMTFGLRRLHREWIVIRAAVLLEALVTERDTTKHRNFHLESDLAVYIAERDAAVARAESAEQDWANREADTMRLGVQCEDAEKDNGDLRSGLAALRAENEVLKRGISAVSDLIDDSQGVYGLHLNGDPSPWGELQTGGRFEDWLVDFDRAALSTKGST